MSRELGEIYVKRLLDALYDYASRHRGNVAPIHNEAVRRILEDLRLRLTNKSFTRLVKTIRYLLEPCRIKGLKDPIVKRKGDKVYVKYPKAYWSYNKGCALSTLVAAKNDSDFLKRAVYGVYIASGPTHTVSVQVDTEVWKELKRLYSHLSDGQIVRLAIYEFLKKWGPFLRALEGTNSGPPLQEANPPSASEHRPP